MRKEVFKLVKDKNERKSDKIEKSKATLKNSDKTNIVKNKTTKNKSRRTSVNTKTTQSKSDTHTTENISIKKHQKIKITQHIITFIFLLFIFGMAILMFALPKKDYSTNEKRYLADMPQFSLQALFDKSFTTEVEEYITDHIPFRDFYVGTNAYYELVSGRNGSNGVYSGEDGYLINDPIDENNNVEKNIKVFADFVQQNNFNATLMVVPSTGYIADDKLPSLHKNYHDDELFEIIDNNKGTMDFIDLRDIFKEEQQNGTQLYYKTDHHWTSNAAYIGYKKICENKGIKATAKSDYYIEIYDKFKGTTYSTSALWLNQSDNIELWQSIHLGEVSVEITENGTTSIYNNMLFKNHLVQSDKYPVYLDGNHALTRIKNSNAPSNTRLLVIKDSFSHCLVPFLSDNYSEILMVDLRYYKDSVSQLAKNEYFNDILILYGLDNLATDTNIAFLE